MRNKLVIGVSSALYLILITVTNSMVLKDLHYYTATSTNIILTMVYAYVTLTSLYKLKISKIESVLDIVNKSRYDYNLDEDTKNNYEESVLSIIQGFNNTKEASKYVLKSSVDLAKVADNVSSKVNDMEVSAEQIAAASEEIAAGSLNQMETINNIFGNIEKVGKNIEDIISELKRIEIKTDASVKLTDDGNEYVQKTKESIEIIKNTMIEYTDSLHNFTDSFSQITRFADIIRDITEQTNLLALNSSIEAARAGEHGKGFAVVANEIGKLSNQSQAASQQISTVIQDMEKKISKLTEEMSTGKDRIEQSVQIAEKTEEAFRKISESTVETRYQISTIGKQMEEIGGYTESVIKSVETIQEISQGNAADCQQFSAAIEDMNNSFKGIVKESNNLKEHLNNLQQTVAKDTMDKYMYQKALDVKEYLDKSDDYDLKKLTNMLNIDEIYLVDTSGIIVKCSDPEGVGLDSFKIDPTSYEASKLKEGYTATPIRKRSHDDQMYKFLHIPYKNGMVISVSLSLQSVLSL
ncbi:methyl-accepting chemotaxis protein [Alkalithermobacter paradoxus]|uniref:Methyl-accepting chemotaxis protein 4 n=1 Tax=Alkalithermobacter paradoxus TaxID=29349 RepID=A0A1V4I621_9FIRM|nr:methyl-accepting chemotaxis protein 4 [[Clostridium] thermoalcaliphilum]